ncbi:PadR family transcriptional regulator [Cryobacterium zhongshanensis]|uniref:PadR family transcriptional regulator n=1 Tax=Cryobacterium zhongshanensis TaxID=2928153 RepID=A0AA41UF80_9MICO|nr:PadR family transcriptional regulator [Cryobacterium zhongshanensis]MCI4658283.1 PadR family transcriptional regulator [Cryobacterium zhongshanensis]
MAENSTSTQLRRGVVGPCILALLSTAPRFGLQLVRDLDEVGHLLSSQGTVYPLLNRLHDAGLVTSYWDVTESERPRRYYRITDAGRRELETFRTDWERFAGSVGTLLATVPQQSVEREQR